MITAGFFSNGFDASMKALLANLKDKINKDQATKLFVYYQDLGENTKRNVNTKEMENRIKELENKFQKEKEQSFLYIFKREFKEKTAKVIVWIIMSIIGFILGFLLGNFF